MLKKIKKLTTTPDFNQSGFNIVAQATGTAAFKPSLISQVMAQMGRKGGLKGGKARAESLSPAERTAIAKKAAQTRWKNK